MMPTDSSHAEVNAVEASAVEHLLLPQRLAEAANYAALCRLAPFLRHDIAGLMQPLGMLLMVLQRRAQMTAPDIEMISKNIASLSAMTKEATTGCMTVIEWIASKEDVIINLQSGVDEVGKLLAMELSATGLTLVNAIAGEGADESQCVSQHVSQRFLRNVLTCALLAFCDQRTAGNMVQVTIEKDTDSTATRDRLRLQMLPGDTLKLATRMDTTPKPRLIDWSDVEALAGSFNVAMTRGEGWLKLGLPSAS